MKSAPHQLFAERFVEAHRAVLVGLLGSGIAASRTPAMHEKEGREHGLIYIYRLLDLDEFGSHSKDVSNILSLAKLFGFSGLNVTHPCKKALIPFLSELSLKRRR